jgi:hypothetical protein
MKVLVFDEIRPLTDSDVEQNDAAIVFEETVQIKIAVVPRDFSVKLAPFELC